MVRETRHLWVGNLPLSVTEERIWEHFKRYGRVQSVKQLPRKEEDTFQSATVAFVDIKSAAKAHNSENKFDDRVLKTDYYEPPCPSTGVILKAERDELRSSNYSSPVTPRSPRYSIGCGEDRSYDRNSSHFYDRRDGDSYNKRGSVSSVYHEGEDFRGRSRDRYRTVNSYSERTLGSNQYRAWNYDSRYSESNDDKDQKKKTDVNLKSLIEKKIVKNKSIRIGSRSRSGSESRSSLATTSSSSSQSSRSSSPVSRSTSKSPSNLSRERLHSSVTAVHGGRNSPEGTEDKRPVSICVRNLPARSSGTSLKDGLFHEYKKYGKVTAVKVFGQGTDRYALVTFKRSEDAEKAVELSQEKLFFGSKIEVVHYSCDDEFDFKLYDSDVDEYHPKASRILFVGNLEKETTTNELRKIFDQFGEIIEIEIKKASNGGHAFVQYCDITSVVRAMKEMDGHILGTSKLKLGFGKTSTSPCLWVAGVAEAISEKYLGRQFARHGVVSSTIIDRGKAQALIFFEQVAAAQKAVTEMRGRSLGGTRLQVDFASRECQVSFFDHLQKSGFGDKAWDRFHPRGIENIRRLWSTNGTAIHAGLSSRRLLYSDLVPERRNYDEYSQGSCASYEDSFEAELREYGYSQRERHEYDEQSSDRTHSSSPVLEKRSRDRLVGISPAPSPTREDDNSSLQTGRTKIEIDRSKFRKLPATSDKPVGIILKNKIRECDGSPLGSKKDELHWSADDARPTKRAKLNDDVSNISSGSASAKTNNYQGVERSVELVNSVFNKIPSVPERNSDLMIPIESFQANRKTVDPKSRRVSANGSNPCVDRITNLSESDSEVFNLYTSPKEIPAEPKKVKVNSETECTKLRIYRKSVCEEGNDETTSNSSERIRRESEDSRPGTPLCDEIPQDVPVEPRRIRNKSSDGPLSLPLPMFAHNLSPRPGLHSPKLNNANSPRAVHFIRSPPQSSHSIRSPPQSKSSVVSPSSVSLKDPRLEKDYKQVEKVSSRHAKDPRSSIHGAPLSPRKLLSRNMVDISDLENSPSTSPRQVTLDDQIKSLHERFEKWACNSRVSGQGCNDTLKGDLEKFRSRHRLIDLEELRSHPSDIVKSVLSRKSVFDEDSKRLETYSEKYEPKDIPDRLANLLKSAKDNPVSNTSSVISFSNISSVSSRFSSVLPYLSSKLSVDDPIASNEPSSTAKPFSGDSPLTPGLKYPFPSHPQVSEGIPAPFSSPITVQSVICSSSITPLTNSMPISDFNAITTRPPDKNCLLNSPTFKKVELPKSIRRESVSAEKSPPVTKIEPQAPIAPRVKPQVASWVLSLPNPTNVPTPPTITTTSTITNTATVTTMSHRKNDNGIKTQTAKKDISPKESKMVNVINDKDCREESKHLKKEVTKESIRSEPSKTISPTIDIGVKNQPEISQLIDVSAEDQVSERISEIVHPESDKRQLHENKSKSDKKSRKDFVRSESDVSETLKSEVKRKISSCDGDILFGKDKSKHAVEPELKRAKVSSESKEKKVKSSDKKESKDKKTDRKDEKSKRLDDRMKAELDKKNDERKRKDSVSVKLETRVKNEDEFESKDSSSLADDLKAKEDKTKHDRKIKSDELKSKNEEFKTKIDEAKVKNDESKAKLSERKSDSKSRSLKHDDVKIHKEKNNDKAKREKSRIERVHDKNRESKFDKPEGKVDKDVPEKDKLMKLKDREHSLDKLDRQHKNDRIDKIKSDWVEKVDRFKDVSKSDTSKIDKRADRPLDSDIRHEKFERELTNTMGKDSGDKKSDKFKIKERCRKSETETDDESFLRRQKLDPRHRKSIDESDEDKSKRIKKKKKLSSDDSCDEDYKPEAKKHSIFDVIIDENEPVYFSMYDKVKARSCKNMQKQQTEDKKTDSLKEKFSALKQKRAKREEKKRSSIDEDTDGESIYLKDGSSHRKQKRIFMLGTSSSEEDMPCYRSYCQETDETDGDLSIKKSKKLKDSESDHDKADIRDLKMPKRNPNKLLDIKKESLHDSDSDAFLPRKKKISISDLESTDTEVRKPKPVMMPSLKMKSKKNKHVEVYSEDSDAEITKIKRLPKVYKKSKSSKVKSIKTIGGNEADEEDETERDNTDIGILDRCDKKTKIDGMPKICSVSYNTEENVHKVDRVSEKRNRDRKLDLFESPVFEKAAKSKSDKLLLKDEDKKRRKSGSSTESFEMNNSETTKFDVKVKTKSKSRKEVELEEIFGPMSDSDSGIVDSKSHTSCRSSSSTKSVNPPEKLHVSEIYGSDSDSTLCSPPKLEIDIKSEPFIEPIDTLEAKNEIKKHNKKKKKKKVEDREKKSKARKKSDLSSVNSIVNCIQESKVKNKFENIEAKSTVYDVFRCSELENTPEEHVKISRKDKKKKKNREYRDKSREDKKEKRLKPELRQDVPAESVTVQELPPTPCPVFTPRSSIESNEGIFSPKSNNGSVRKSSEDLFDEAFGFRSPSKSSLVKTEPVCDVKSEPIDSSEETCVGKIQTESLDASNVLGHSALVSSIEDPAEQTEFALHQIIPKKEPEETTNKCRAVISQEETEDAVAAILGASFRFNYSEPSPPRVEDDNPFDSTRVSDVECDHVNPMDDEALQAVQNLESEMPSFHSTETSGTHDSENQSYLNNESVDQKLSSKLEIAQENESDKTPSYKCLNEENSLVGIPSEVYKQPSEDQDYASKVEPNVSHFSEGLAFENVTSAVEFDDDVDSEDKDEDNLVISETPPLSCEPVVHDENDNKGIVENSPLAEPTMNLSSNGNNDSYPHECADEDLTKKFEARDITDKEDSIHKRIGYSDSYSSYLTPCAKWDNPSESVIKSEIDIEEQAEESFNDFERSPSALKDDGNVIIPDIPTDRKAVSALDNLDDPLCISSVSRDDLLETIKKDVDETASNSTFENQEPEIEDDYSRALDVIKATEDLNEYTDLQQAPSIVDAPSVSNVDFDDTGKENETIILNKELPESNTFRDETDQNFKEETEQQIPLFDESNNDMIITQSFESKTFDESCKLQESRGRGRGRKSRPSARPGSLSPRSPRCDTVLGSRIGLLTRSASRQKPKTDHCVDIDHTLEEEEEYFDNIDASKARKIRRRRISECEPSEEFAVTKNDKQIEEPKNAFDVFEFHDSEDEGDDFIEKRDDKAKRNKRDGKRLAKDKISGDEEFPKQCINASRSTEEPDKDLTEERAPEAIMEHSEVRTPQVLVSPSKSPISVRKSRRLLEKDGRTTVDDIIDEVIRNSLNENTINDVDEKHPFKPRHKIKPKEDVSTDTFTSGRKKIGSKIERVDMELDNIRGDKEPTKLDEPDSRSLIDPVTGLLIPVKECDEGQYFPVSFASRSSILGAAKPLKNILAEQSNGPVESIESLTSTLSNYSANAAPRSSVVTSVGVPINPCSIVPETTNGFVSRPTVLHTSSSVDSSEIISLQTASDSRLRPENQSPSESRVIPASRFCKSFGKETPDLADRSDDQESHPKNIEASEYMPHASSAYVDPSTTMSFNSARTMASAVATCQTTSSAGIAALPSQTAKVTAQPGKPLVSATDTGFGTVKEYVVPPVRVAAELKIETARNNKMCSDRSKSGSFKPTMSDRELQSGLGSSTYDNYVSRGADRPGRMIMELLQNPHYLQQQREIPIAGEQLGQTNLTPPPSLPSTPPTAHQSEIMRMSGSTGMGMNHGQLNPHYVQQHFLYQHYLRAQQEAAISQRIPYSVHSIRSFDGRPEVKEKDGEKYLTEEEQLSHRPAHLPLHLRQPSPATSSERSTDSPIIANLYHGSNQRSNPHNIIPQRLVNSHMRSSGALSNSGSVPSAYPNSRSTPDFSSIKNPQENLVPPPPPAHQVKSLHHSHHLHPTPASEAPVNPVHLNPVTPLPSHPRAQVQTPPYASQVPPQADSLLMLLQRYPVMWQGLLALKNDQAAVQMHFVSGNPDVARGSLPVNSDGSTPPLRIAQRMRLEQSQLDGVARKMQMEAEHCMLLALPCGHDHMDVLQQSNNLRSGFITYLQLKQAAGIVNVAAPGSQQPAYVVHIFPSCDFSNENLARIAPDLLHSVADIAHLLIIIATV